MSFKVTQRDGSGRDSAVFSVAVTPLVNGTLDANAVHPRSGSGGETRVNVKKTGKSQSTHWTQFFRDVFLPAGYPTSVSPDYLQCQIYYGLQAFCSSLASLIANRAVLEGHGIGKADASATDAMLLTVLQEAFSRLTTILSAYFLGTSLFPEAKTYRLVADIANDVAIFFDLLSPQLSPYSLSLAFPFIIQRPGIGLRLTVLCLSGAFKALCGVTAGGARAALTLHFAQDGDVPGDVGDLSAKDASKETVLALLGMLCGSLIMPYLQTARSTYAVVLFLLSCHLLANYIAVRVVVMRSLNRQRASILWSAYRDTTQGKTSVGVSQRILTPEQVATKEYTFGHSDILHRTGSSLGVVVGRGIIGVPISEVLTATPASSLAFWRRRGRTSAVTGLDSLLPHLIKAFSNEKYILWAEARHSTHNVQVFLKDGHTALDHLKAWLHAADFVSLCPLNASSLPELMHHLEESKKTVDRHFQTFVGGLKEAGWDIDAPGLVSGSPITIQIEEVVGNGGEDKKNV